MITRKYEAMFILKIEISEEEKQEVYGQIKDTIAKNGGTITNAAVWNEKRKMTFPIKKHQEGLYYLVTFTSPAESIVKMKQIFQINENILRVLITIQEK